MAQESAAVFGSASRSRHAVGGPHPRDHGDPLQLFRGAGGPARRPRDAEGSGLRAWRHALGGDPGRALLRPHGNPRGRDARFRTRARRDHGRHDGHRQQSAVERLAFCAAAHHGRRHRQRVHGGRGRPLPVGLGRDRARPLRADRPHQRDFTVPDLADGPGRGRRRNRRSPPAASGAGA